jgi:hypothetical protein
VAAALGVVGIGMGLSMAPATDSIMGAVPADKATLGSAINDTTRMVGGTLGVAILGSVLSSSYRSHVAGPVSHLHGAAAAAAHDRLQGALSVAAQIGGSAGRQLAFHADSSFVSAMDATLRVGVVFALAGALLALLFLPARAEQSPEPVAVDGDLALAA